MILFVAGGGIVPRREFRNGFRQRPGDGRPHRGPDMLLNFYRAHAPFRPILNECRDQRSVEIVRGILLEYGVERMRLWVSPSIACIGREAVGDWAQRIRLAATTRAPCCTRLSKHGAAATCQTRSDRAAAFASMRRRFSSRENGSWRCWSMLRGTFAAASNSSSTVHGAESRTQLTRA